MQLSSLLFNQINGHYAAKIGMLKLQGWTDGMGSDPDLAFNLLES